MIQVAGLRTKFAFVTAFLLGLPAAMANASGMGLPVASFSAGGTGLTSFYVLGFELGPWQEYLAQELTPDYLLPDGAVPVRVSWLRYSDVMILPDFANSLGPEPESYFFMNLDYQSSGQYLVPEVSDDSVSAGFMFEREYFSPGIEHQISDNGVLGVAAVVVYQRFSSANLGLISATSPERPFWPNSGYTPFAESGYGTGVQLSLRQEVFKGVAVETGYQSRIDMEEFAALRGVYANPADLDIPARVRFGVEFRTSAQSWLSASIEQVMYSDINAFPSRYLPNRFLSLLGDSTSPSFDWQDLTVYSVGWNWSDGARQQWHLGFSTRQQPLPSSTLLRQALESELAKNAILVGYSRRTGATSQFSFNAAYAPAEYAFGGSVLGITTDVLDQRFEVQALWTLAF